MGFFEILRSGGIRHLDRHVAEFELRYNNPVANGVYDAARSVQTLCGTRGRRLMYSDSWSQAVA